MRRVYARLSFLVVVPLLLGAFGDSCEPVSDHLEEQFPGVKIPSQVVLCSGADPKTCEPKGGGGGKWYRAKNILQPAVPTLSLAASDPVANVATVTEALRKSLARQVVGNTYSNGSVGFCLHGEIVADEQFVVRVNELQYESKVDDELVAKFAANLSGKLQAGKAPLDAAAKVELAASLSKIAKTTVSTSMYYFYAHYQGRWEDLAVAPMMKNCLRKAVQESSALIMGVNGLLFVDAKTKFQSTSRADFSAKIAAAIEANENLRGRLNMESLSANIEVSFSSARDQSVSINQYLSPFVELGWIQFSPAVGSDAAVMDAFKRSEEEPDVLPNPEIFCGEVNPNAEVEVTSDSPGTHPRKSDRHVGWVPIPVKGGPIQDYSSNGGSYGKAEYDVSCDRLPATQVLARTSFDFRSTVGGRCGRNGSNAGGAGGVNPEWRTTVKLPGKQGRQRWEVSVSPSINAAHAEAHCTVQFGSASAAALNLSGSSPEYTVDVDPGEYRLQFRCSGPNPWRGCYGGSEYTWETTKVEYGLVVGVRRKDLATAGPNPE